MVKNYLIRALAATGANGNSADLNNDDPLSIGAGRFYVNVSGAPTGTTPVLVITIEEYDPTSNTYSTVLASANITAAGTTVLSIGPGFPVTANVSANTILSRNFRVRWTITGTTPSFNFSIGASIS